MDGNSRKEPTAIGAQCRLRTLLHAARLVISLKVAHIAGQRNALGGRLVLLSCELLLVRLKTRSQRNLAPASVPSVVLGSDAEGPYVSLISPVMSLTQQLHAIIVYFFLLSFFFTTGGFSSACYRALLSSSFRKDLPRSCQEAQPRS